MSSTYHDRKIVKDRIRELVVDHDSGTRSLINAYKLKSELKSLNLTDVREFHGTNSTKKADPDSPYYKIRTLDPLIVVPEKRFEHTPGAVITSNANHSKLKKVITF
jgi:hypothetical protein